MPFRIDRKTSVILIYGAGALGRKCFAALKENGFHVAGFIDRNKDRLTRGTGKDTIYAPDEIRDVDCVVIVCVHNALWHTSIALDLKERGIRKIVFIPSMGDFDMRKACKMMEACNAVYFEDFDCLTRPIPTIDELERFDISEKCSVIRSAGRYYYIWVDITCLYSSVCPQKHRGEILSYRNTPMPGMTPYTQLFAYLEDPEKGSCDLFLSLMKQNQDTFPVCDEEYLSDRRDLFLSLKEQQNIAPDFFVFAAPEAEWNERGFYSLVDGMSRTTFLYKQGYRFVPVRIKKEQYGKSILKKELNAFRTLLRKSGRKSLDYDVEHPAFIDFPVQNRMIAFRALCMIQEYFADRKWEGKKVVDGTHYHGRIARYFARQGAKAAFVSRDCEYDASLNSIFSIRPVVTDRLGRGFDGRNALLCVSIREHMQDGTKELLECASRHFGELLVIFEGCGKTDKEKLEKKYSVAPKHELEKQVGHTAISIRHYLL